MNVRMNVARSVNEPPQFDTLPPSPSRYVYPGAKWWKMDFHTHTPQSVDYAGRAGEKREELKAQTPEDWLERHMAWGVDALVVTDHNSTGFIGELKEAYARMEHSSKKFRPLVIFPGFELSVNGGLHLLAIFDPNKNLEDISGVITACGFLGTRGDTNVVCSESFEKCVEIVKKNGGLTVAAHIDESCGLLWNKLTTGEEVRDLMRNNSMSHEDAVEELIKQQKLTSNVRSDALKINQTVNSVLAAGLDAIEVYGWEVLPAAMQEHPVLARLARVTGSDSHMPRDIGRNGFSMVHMTHPNIEGLRMAFADGSAIRAKGGESVKESWSVRPIDKTDLTDWNLWPDSAIEKLSISGFKTAGRRTPLEFPLHPRLNVLVGGRGSGKSSFVHALRLSTQRALELPRYEGERPVNESPAGDFWRWAKVPDNRDKDGVLLKDKSKIKLLYRSPAQMAELCWSASDAENNPNSSPSVCVGELESAPTEDGGAYSPGRFPVSIYSQKQVLEMSRGASGLLAIIDREQNVSLLKEQLDLAVATYSATKAKIRELQTTFATEAQDQASLKDIIAELGKVQSPAAKEFQKRQAQARAFLPNLNPEAPLLLLMKEIQEQTGRLRLPEVPTELIPETDSLAVEALTIYENAQREINGLAEVIQKQTAEIETTLSTLNENLRSSAWFKACLKSKDDYQNLLGSHTSALNSDRLNKLNRDRAELEQRLAKFKGTKQELVHLESLSKRQRETINEKRSQISETREKFVSAHNQKGTLLRIALKRMGADMPSVEISLREALGVGTEKFSSSIGIGEGARSDSLMQTFRASANKETGTEEVRQRILELIDSSENLPGFADLQNNLRKQLSSIPARRESIETWFPDDRLELEYRTAESGEWKSISQGSIGQQTAAILSFLLSFGNEPLVLDQPEDDLDTRMIMSLIVEQIRTMKGHRQIIIVTHNPNIVVHGDADLVHAMIDASGQICREEKASGGLQEKETRKFICDVMEGGAIAFRKRYDRMGRQES